MDKLQSLKIFRLVAEQGSFIAAANRMDISAGKTSKNIMALEEQLGVRLMNRTSRSLSLTEAGLLYLERVQAVLDSLEETEALISNTNIEPKGVLRITGPGWLATDIFMDVINSYQQTYPDVHLYVNITGNMTNLVEDGYDLALRCSPKFTSDYVARPIAKVQFNFVASPEYIEQRGVPETAADLTSHDLLWYPAIPKSSSGFPGGASSDQVFSYEPTITCDNEAFLLEGVLKGMGIAFLPIWMTQKHIQQRRMLKVLDQYSPVFELVAMYPSRRYLSLKVRTFIDFLVADKRLNI